MAENDDVCVLVPTYDEAETIRDVVEGFRAAGYANILVVDGGSTDGTREIAADAGARVRVQSGSGKGQAIREALDYIDAASVLMADGDRTYRPEEADRMLEPIRAGRAEHVIGNRFANMQPGAMPRLNRVGNRLFNWLFRVIHGRDYADILSGYRAFTLESIRSLFLTEDGFGIETEMAVECVKKGVSVVVVPITYEPRPASSEANLSPLRDGAIIIKTLYQMAKTSNPLFYFGSVGTASTLIGVVVAAYVAVEWVTRGISHEVLAVVAGISLLFGVQLLIFGVLSDLIVTLNREQTRQFERLTERLTEDAVAAPGDQPAGATGDGDSQQPEGRDEPPGAGGDTQSGPGSSPDTSSPGANAPDR
ncbi:MAG: S-layer glycoprotein N-glycosyltransferase AglJ [Haloarculaceae archaeon]